MVSNGNQCVYMRTSRMKMFTKRAFNPNYQSGARTQSRIHSKEGTTRFSKVPRYRCLILICM